MTAHRVLAPLLAVIVLVAGCGKEQTVQRRIHDDTADVVRAINAKDVAAARAALSTLDADLLAAGRLDQLDDATVTTLRTGVSQLRADLALLAPTPTPTPVHRTTPPPTEPKKRHGKGDKDD